MKAIFKPFFALCGMIALSTALSADSRVSPVGGAASSGAAGFLYSDYLQTASDEGHELGFQGSFVVAERRSFLSGLADIGGGFSGRVLEEVQSLPLREWGLHALGGGIFEGERPAHRRALLERGWRLADWLADETLLAATEGGRASGFIRTFELDVRSELGGRRAQVGLNVLGALRERNDDAVAWQLRGFKSSKGQGGNAGLIYRRLAGDALAGANVFLDYETYSGDGFWRWSGGTEFRSAWVDVFGNVYKAISDEEEDGNVRIYTADGYELELNVHSPDVPWLTGEATYYNWDGKGSLKDDSGIRWGLKLAPWAGLEFGLEYENQDDSKNKSFAGRVSYRGNFGGVDAGQSGGGGAFEARDWFFAPAEREYSQRIRKYEATNFQIVIDFDRTKTPPTRRFPITVVKPGGVREIIMSAAELPLTVIVPSGTTVTISDNDAATSADPPLVLTYPRTGGRVEIRSTVAFALDGDRDFFRLVEGGANITLAGGTNAGFSFVAEQFATTMNFRRFELTLGHTLSIAVSANPVPVTLTRLAGKITLTTRIPPPQAKTGVMFAGGVIGGTPIEPQQIAGLMASTVLVQADTETPPRFFATGASANAVVVATLEASGGGVPYIWGKAASEGGQLLINNEGVVSIPANTSPNGNTLTLKAVVDDTPAVNAPVNPEPLTVGFTIVYRTLEQLAAATKLAVDNRIASGTPNLAFHPSGGISLVVATLEASKGLGGYTWTGTGELQINNDGVVWIPASQNPALPGRVLTVRAILNDNAAHPLAADTEPLTVDFTVRYEARDPLTATAVAATDNSLDSDATPPVYYTESTLAAAAILVATVQHSGGGGDRTLLRQGGQLLLDDTTGALRIPAGSIPTAQGLLLSARVLVNDDPNDPYGAQTPPVIVDFTVSYQRITPLAVVTNYAQGISPPTAGPPPLPARAFHDSGGISLAVATLEASGGVGGNTWTGTGQLEIDNSGAVWIPDSQTPTNAGRILTIRAVLEDSSTHPSTGRTEPVTVDLTVRYELQSPLTADIEFTSDNSLNRRESPPGFYVAANVADGEHIVATVRHTGGGGDRDRAAERGTFRWDKAADPEGGQLLIDRASGEVRIPSSAVPTAEGVSLSLQAILNDDPADPYGAVSPPLTVKLTVVYKLIAGLAARINIADGVVAGSEAITAQIRSGGGDPYTLTLYYDSAGRRRSSPIILGTPVYYDANGNRINSPVTRVVTPPEQSKFYVRPAVEPRTINIVRLERRGSRRVAVEGTNPPIFREVPTFATITTETVIPGIPAQTMTTNLNVIPASPALLLTASGSAEAITVATMTASGGGGSYSFRAEPGGGLLVNLAGVVRIPGGEVPTADGRTLTVRAILNDDPGTAAGLATDPVTVDFAVVYRTGLPPERRGEVVLASDSLIDASGDVPVFYSDGAAETALIAATLQSNGRQANEVWSNQINKFTVGARQGQLPDGVLEVDGGGVVRIPAGTEPTAAGRTMTLAAVVNYNYRSEDYTLRVTLQASTVTVRGTSPAFDRLTVGFTLAYRLRPLADWEHFISGQSILERRVTIAGTGGRVVTTPVRVTAWGLADSPAIPLATAVIDGRGVFSATRIAGGLDVARQPSGEWAAIIPANTRPGGELTLAARVAGLDTLPPRTVGLTALFNALTPLRTELRPAQMQPAASQFSGGDEFVDVAPLRLVSGVLNVGNISELHLLASPTRDRELFALTPSGGAAGETAEYEFSVVGSPAEDFLRFNAATGDFLLKEGEPGNNSEVFEITVVLNDKGLGSELTPPLSTILSIRYLAFNTPLPSYPPLGLTWTNEQTSAETRIPPPPREGNSPFTRVRVDAKPEGRVSLIAGRFMATGGSGNARVESAEILPLFIDPKTEPEEIPALRERYLPLEFLPDGRVRIEATCIGKDVSIRVRVSDAESGASQIFRAAVATEACPPPAFSDLEAKLAGKIPRDDRNKLNSLLRFGGQEFNFITRGTDDGAPVDLNSVIRTFYVPDEGSTTSGREYVILRDIRFKNGDRDANLIVERGGDRFGLRRTDEGVYEIRFKRGQAYNTGNAHAVLVLRAQNTGGGSIVRTEIGVDRDGNRVARLVTTTVAGNPEFAAREPRRYTLRIHTGRFTHFEVYEVNTSRPGGGRLIEGGDFASILYYGGSTLAADTNIADIRVVEGPGRSNLETWVWQVEGGNTKAVAFLPGGANGTLRRVQIKNGQVPDADNIFRVTVSVRMPNEGNIQATVTVSALVVDPRHADLKAQLGNTTITADLNNPITLSAASATPLTTQILVLQSLGLNLQLLQLGQDEEFTRVNKIGGDLEYARTGTVGSVFISRFQPPGTTLSLILQASDGDGIPNNRGHVDTLRQHRPDRTYSVTVVYAAPPTTMTTTPPVVPLPPLPRRDVAVTAHLSDTEGMRVPGGRILDFYEVVPGDPRIVPSQLQQPPLPTRLAIAEVVSQGANTLEIIGDDLALDGGTLYIPAGTLPSLPGQPTTLQSEVVVADVADLLEPTTLTVRGRYLATSGRLEAGAEDNSGGAIIAEHLMYAVGATSSPVAVASITARRPSVAADRVAAAMVRADPSNLAYRALGDLEVDAQGRVLIPADVAPLTPPNGQLLTGAIVVSSDAQNFDFAPTTVSITVRYVLAEPLGTLQMKVIPRHVLAKTDANGNLDTSQRITTFNSHLESFAERFVGTGIATRQGFATAPLTIAELSIPNAPAETLITSTRPEVRGYATGTTTTIAVPVTLTVGAQIDIVSRRNIGGIETEVPGGSGLAVIKEGGKTLLVNPSRQAYGELFTATLRVSDTNDNALSRTRPVAYYTITAVHMLSVETEIFGPNLESRTSVFRGVSYVANRNTTSLDADNRAPSGARAVKEITVEIGSGEGVMYYSNAELTNGARYHKGQRRVALLKPRAPESIELEAESIPLAANLWPGSVEEFSPGTPRAGFVLKIDGAQRVLEDRLIIDGVEYGNHPHYLRNQARVVWKEKNLAPGAVSKVLPATLTVPIRNVEFTLGVEWNEDGLLPVFKEGAGRTTLAITVNSVEGNKGKRELGYAFANVRALDAFRPAIYYPPGAPKNSPISNARQEVHNPGNQFSVEWLNSADGRTLLNRQTGGPVRIDFDPDDNIPPEGGKIFFELGWQHMYPGLGPHAERTTQGSDHYLWVKVVYQTRPIALSIRTPRTLGNTYLRDQDSRGENDPYKVAVSRAGELGTLALFHVNANDGARDDSNMTLKVIERNGFHVVDETEAGRSWPVQISADVQANGQTLTLIAEVNDGDSGDAQYTKAQRITLRAAYGDYGNPIIITTANSTMTMARVAADPRVRGSFSAHGDAAEPGVVANALEYTRRFPNVPLSLRATSPIDPTLNLVNLSGGSDADSTTPLTLSIVLNTGFDIVRRPNIDNDPDNGRAWLVRIASTTAAPVGQTLSLVVELDDQGPAAFITPQPARITLQAIYGTPPDILEAESKVGFISPADSALRPANIADRLLGVGETPLVHRRRSSSRPRLALAPFPASGGG